MLTRILLSLPEIESLRKLSQSIAMLDAIIKGFDHESPMSPYATGSGKPWPGMFDNVPSEFESFLLEPAFSINDTTFCTWRRYADVSWQIGNIDYPDGDDPDGSEDLLFMLDGKSSTYQRFAEEYYERDIDLMAVERIYKHEPLTDEIVTALNADCSSDHLEADVVAIGYPAGSIISVLQS